MITRSVEEFQLANYPSRFTLPETTQFCAELELRCSAVLPLFPARSSLKMSSTVVPELLAKRQKRDAQWQAEKAAAALEARKKTRETRAKIFKRAESYVKEYLQQVHCWLGFKGWAR
jgi:hypothetical protein